MRVETTTQALGKLSSRIDALQEKVLLGILRLDKADKALREIRTGLIEIRQIIRSDFTLDPAAPVEPENGDGNSPNAA